MKISIITVVLNNKQFILDCIESVKKQTYADIEYIIIDGGSTDGTVKIIRENQPCIDQWISEEDQGIYDALNKGIRLASGEVIGFLNADDIFYSRDIVQKIVRIFKDNKIEAVYGDLVYMNKSLTRTIRYWESGQYKPGIFKTGWMLPHPTFYVRKSVYTKYGLYDTRFKISADYEIMLRLLEKKKIAVYYISEIVVIMRVGGVSNSGIKNLIRKSK